MRLRATVTVVIAVVVVLGGVSAHLGVTAAEAQDGKPAQPKGVSSHGLVTSLGPVATFPVTVPAALSGQVVDLAPGGQTGTQRNLVPSFLYVIQGTLAIDTKGGPIGISGMQYHTEGQSYSAPVGTWYNVTNATQEPARYLLLFVGPPGGATVEQAKAEE
jgi:quercetin dioxygenase-like cupin family protein